MSDKIELYKALAKFQQSCPIIHKATQGHNYTYATLDSIIKTINPVMARNGLGFTQLIEGDNQIRTILFHCESGASIESIISMPENVAMKGMNPMQSLGSNITYCKRYALGSMLGVITDKDIDGAGEQLVKNKYRHHLVDEYENDPVKLKPMLISAIVSDSLIVDGHNSIQKDDIEGESMTQIDELFFEYLAKRVEFNASNWWSEQLNKPRNTGTLKGLENLWNNQIVGKEFDIPSIRLKVNEQKELLESKELKGE